MQASAGEIAHTVDARHVGLVYKLFSVAELVFKYEAAYLAEMLDTLGIIVVIRASRPECLFIELDFIGGNAPVYHRADTRVTYRICLHPG